MLRNRIRISGISTSIDRSNQSVIDEKVTGSKNIKWTVSELKSAFSDLSNTILRERLEKILYWSVANSFFKESVTENHIFKIVGKSVKPIFSIYGSGGIYLFTNTDYYLGGVAERNETVDKLKDIDLLRSVIVISIR